MLLPIDLPPGVYRVGTAIDSMGRWLDASLVRWRDGSLRPVGGWRDFSSVTGIPRGAHGWSANNGGRWYAFGTHDSLYSITGGGTSADITPAGFTSGRASAAVNLAYGGGLYGAGTYGTARADTGAFQPATVWTMDNWGQNLIACADTDGKLYEWTLTGDAATISNAPTGCNAVVVTEERFVFALGAGGNPRKVQWCDQEDNTEWTPAATNQAGDILLETQGEIMLGKKARGSTLILTNTDAHAANYIGGTLVYGFERVGDNCGVISRQGAASFNFGTMWMGREQFFYFDGSGVQAVRCEVADFVFANINRGMESHVCAIPNAQHNEIWWFFPSNDSAENNRYVAYNYAEQFWMCGYIGRTSGVDRGAGRYPIWADAAGELYQHEVGLAHGAEDVYAESGPISIDTGETAFMCRRVLPDEQTQGDVTLTFKTRRYPNATEYVHGPYTMEAPTVARFSGRQARMKVTGARDTAWRFGVPRLDVVGRGVR